MKVKEYSFKMVIETLGIEPDFVETLEKEDIVVSKRRGKGVFYTEWEVRKIALARDLWEMGINLAGIDIILDMSERINQMRKEIDELLYGICKYIEGDKTRKK